MFQVTVLVNVAPVIVTMTTRVRPVNVQSLIALV